MLSTIELNLSRDLRNDEIGSVRSIGDATFSTASDPDKVFMSKVAPVAVSRAASTFARSGALSWFRAGDWIEEPEGISDSGASVTMDRSGGKG